jgi:hypothetical protein
VFQTGRVEAALPQSPGSRTLPLKETDALSWTHWDPIHVPLLGDTLERSTECQDRALRDTQSWQGPHAPGSQSLQWPQYISLKGHFLHPVLPAMSHSETEKVYTAILCEQQSSKNTFMKTQDRAQSGTGEAALFVSLWSENVLTESQAFPRG